MKLSFALFCYVYRENIVIAQVAMARMTYLATAILVKKSDGPVDHSARPAG